MTKNFFKMIPAALAVFALASCSTDDLTEGKKSIQYSANDLEVSIESLDGTAATRAAYYYNGSENELLFQTGDQIRVYGEDVIAYSKYTFADGKFTTTAATPAPAYAFFPYSAIQYADADTKKVVVKIPNKLVFGLDTETEGKTPAYVSNLPQWGIAVQDGDHLKTTLYRTTAVLKLTMDAIAESGTKYLLVKADQPLTGAFELDLSKAPDANDAQLVKRTEGEDGDVLANGKEMLIDLTGCVSSHGVVYIPVISGVKYSTLTITTANADGTLAGTEGDVFNMTTGIPAAAKDSEGKYAFKRGAIIGINKTFEISEKTTEAVSRALSYATDATGALTFKVASSGLELKRNTNVDDHTIYVPEMTSKDVTIDLQNIYGKDGPKLDITGKEEYGKTHEYDGKITIKGTLQNSMPISVNLPKADVVIAGNYGASDAMPITILAAKSITFGDGETATSSQSTITLVDGDGKSTVAESVTIEAKAEIKSDIILGSDVTSDFELNVKGRLPETSKAVRTGLATTNISGDGYVANLGTKGNVNIDDNEDVVSVYHLYIQAKNTTVKIKQGLIYDIAHDGFTFAATDGITNYVRTDDAAQGIAAIQTVNANLLPHVDFGKEATASKWNGKTISETNKTYVTTNIYTASQLASAGFVTNDAKTLYADVDLQNKVWTSPTTGGNFNGQNHTVKNLNLALSSATSPAKGSAGFFGYTQSTTIKDFTIDGVTFNPSTDVTTGSDKIWYTHTNVGAVVGTIGGASMTTTISGVTVKNAKFGETTTRTDIHNVGALVGNVSGANTKAALTGNTVETTSIRGYYGLGGLVGDVANGAIVVIQKNSVAPTFAETNSLPADKQSDVNFGKIGDLVGTITEGTVNVITAAANANTITSGVAGNKQTLKFHQHKNYYVNGDETQEQYYFGCQADNNWVGFSATGATLQKDGTAQTNRYTAAGNSVAVTTPATETNFNYFVLSESSVAARAK